MSTRPDSESSPTRTPSSPDDLLPAVQAPNAGFLLQLFLIPLMIVSVIVLVWLLFSWLASAGSEPRELVRDLKKLNNSSWQKAVSLANQLQDPQYDALKDDAALAQELADVLKGELAAAKMDEARLSLRVYLCRILGEFRVENGLAPLLDAALQEKSADELRVRAAALESIAVLINNRGAETMRESAPLRKTLRECSQTVSEGADADGAYAELRSRAAFALGVLGGDEARTRLAQMLNDAYPNARYNAATGLARQGDVRCAKVLLEMLDPQNVETVKGETLESNKEAKRLSVLVNGLRAAEMLLLRESSEPAPDDLKAVKDAVVRLSETKDAQAVGMVAREVLQNIAPAPKPLTPAAS